MVTVAQYLDVGIALYLVICAMIKYDTIMDILSKYISTYLSSMSGNGF